MTLLSAADGPRWRPKMADVIGMQVDWGQARLKGIDTPLTTTRLALTGQLQYGQWFWEGGLGGGFGRLEAGGSAITYTEAYSTVATGYAFTPGRAVITPTLAVTSGYGCPRDECNALMAEWGGGLRLGLMPGSAHPAVQNTRPPVELTMFAGQAFAGRTDGWALRFGVRVRPFANF